MGQAKTGGIIVGAVLAGIGGALILTNPEPQAYQDYATEQLLTYAKQEFCEQAPSDFGNFLGNACQSLLETGRTPAREWIISTTQRQNFLFFSIYRTDLDLNEVLPTGLFGQDLPAYHAESVGIFQQFFTYKAEEQQE